MRSLVGERAAFQPAVLPRNTLARDLQRGTRIHAECSPDSETEPPRPPNPEPYQQPLRRLSTPTYPSQFTGHRGGGHSGIAFTTFGPSIDEDVSLGSWHSQRNASTSASQNHGTSFPSYAIPSWPLKPALSPQGTDPDANNARHRRGSEAKQVIMALREDQFGRILDVMSPSKKQQHKQQHRPHRSGVQSHRPPKMAPLSVPVRPTPTALARHIPPSHSNSTTIRRAKRPSSDQTSFSTRVPVKTNIQPLYHTGKQDHRDPRTSTHSPFVREPLPWDSDVSIKDGSSNLSSRSRIPRGLTGPGSNIGSAHAPSAGGEIKGRKEGHAGITNDAFDNEIRHDGSLFQALNANATTQATPAADNVISIQRGGSKERCADILNEVEIICVDAIDRGYITEASPDLDKPSPFKPGHKVNVSSVSSTGRLERQLYSALGEELSSFEQQMNTAGMGPELPQALCGTADSNERDGSTLLDPTVSEFEPAVKRKRQGTISDEEHVVSKKKEKAQKTTVEIGDIAQDMPQLRGD